VKSAKKLITPHEYYEAQRSRFCSVLHFHSLFLIVSLISSLGTKDMRQANLFKRLVRHMAYPNRASLFRLIQDWDGL